MAQCVSLTAGKGNACYCCSWSRVRESCTSKLKRGAVLSLSSLSLSLFQSVCTVFVHCVTILAVYLVVPVPTSFHTCFSTATSLLNCTLKYWLFPDECKGEWEREREFCMWEREERQSMWPWCNNNQRFTHSPCLCKPLLSESLTIWPPPRFSQLPALTAPSSLFSSPGLFGNLIASLVQISTAAPVNSLEEITLQCSIITLHSFSLSVFYLSYLLFVFSCRC